MKSAQPYWTVKYRHI